VGEILPSLADQVTWQLCRGSKAMKISCFLVVGASCLLCSSCVTVYGESASEIKRRLQETFLYKSATAFATPNGATPFDTEERLKSDQKSFIKTQYQQLAAGIVKSAETHRERLATAFPALRTNNIRPKVQMSDSGLDAPHIDAKGEIFVDVKVARLIYRDAVLEGMRKRSVRAKTSYEERTKCAPDKSDSTLLNCFMELRHRLDSVREQGIVGALVDVVKDKEFSEMPWFQAVDIADQSNDLQSHYIGVLLFVTAHEVAHVMLGHVGPTGSMTAANAEERRAAEFAADDLAVTLVALLAGQTVVFDFFPGFATGYEVFFKNTYQNARWADASDTHPPRNERLDRAQRLHRELRNKQLDDMFDALVRVAEQSAVPATGKDEKK
jgi:hypothetical protein